MLRGMKAKHSVILLSGLLLVMMFVGWAQRPGTERPSCPAVADSMEQMMLEPTAWVRADWNANTSRWDIDCTQIDPSANIPVSNVNASVRAPGNAMNALPRRRGSRSSTISNQVNTNPYKAPPDMNVYPGVNANVIYNQAKPARRP